MITMYPGNYSNANYTFEVYAGTDGASATIGIPDLKEGEVVTLTPTEFTVLDAPCAPKKIKDGEKEGDTWI